MGQGRAGIYNLISLIFLILSVVVIILGISRYASTPPVNRTVAVVVPTQLVLPSLTPSFTPSVTPPPTWTLTPTNTDTPEPLPTETPVPPTVAPSVTIRPSATITETPTITLTPTDTPTITPTFTPTGPTPVPTDTPSPYPFTLRNNEIALTRNFANTAGCQWQGLGGQVFDLNDQPLSGVTVHVYGGQGVDLYTSSGTNSLYGQGSGWEVPVDTTINNQTYFVELQSSEGTVISPAVQITFPGSCDGNLAIVNFEQNRPF